MRTVTVHNPADARTPNVAGAVETTIFSHLHPRPSWEVADHGMPTGREETWRFSPIRRMRALLNDTPSDAALTWDADLPAGVSTRLITGDDARALSNDPPVDRVAVLAASNAPFVRLVEVAAEAELTEPVMIRLTGSGEQVWGHIIVRIGESAKATIVIRHEGSANYAAKTDILVGDGAQVDVVSVQDWDADAVHGGQQSVRVGRDARVRTVQASLGGDIVRMVERAEFAGPGGELEQFGLYFVDAGQHVEHRLFVDHNAPHTKSHVDYRGALQGQGAHSVWIGDVLIRKVAEGINTYETNKNLVLTDGCRADSVPNLEIQTGEIEGAGHSSSTGRFDDEQLFYLKSRGIPDKDARRLVVRGFFTEIIRRIGVDVIERRLEEVLEHELELTMGAADGLSIIDNGSDEADEVAEQAVAGVEA